MASLSYVLSLLQGVPIAAQILTIIAAIPIAIYAYDWVRKERLLPGYPPISLDGKTPEESWIIFPKGNSCQRSSAMPGFTLSSRQLHRPQIDSSTKICRGSARRRKCSLHKVCYCRPPMVTPQLQSVITRQKKYC
ncbi:hypothetical protein FPANT_3397 [Fusarium pseudoanthophilum]|uniref:Uncharacterized protein n=1 Tax=Fusarium pseudoanthophilum TaxID=48495 RepID=A0A8H5UVY7_9HYPO|nr:hypothetical protein FPANT_3397 [Fusarium pseudoanthophilum]